MAKKKDMICYGIVATLVVLYIWIFGCPIKFFTGISCPGCGMTRACMSFVKGNFTESFRYHPLVVLIPVMGVLFVCTISKKIYNKNRKIIDLLWYVIGSIFIIIYFVRVIIVGSDIVSVDVNKSFFMKGINFIRNKL